MIIMWTCRVLLTLILVGVVYGMPIYDQGLRKGLLLGTGMLTAVAALVGIVVGAVG